MNLFFYFVFVLCICQYRFNVDERSIVSHVFHKWAKKQAFQDPKRLLDKVKCFCYIHVKALVRTSRCLNKARVKINSMYLMLCSFEHFNLFYNLQVGFVIDERLRVKNNKQKVV